MEVYADTATVTSLLVATRGSDCHFTAACCDARKRLSLHCLLRREGGTYFPPDAAKVLQNVKGFFWDISYRLKAARMAELAAELAGLAGLAVGQAGLAVGQVGLAVGQVLHALPL